MFTKQPSVSLCLCCLVPSEWVRRLHLRHPGFTPQLPEYGAQFVDAQAWLPRAPVQAAPGPSSECGLSASPPALMFFGKASA